MDSQARRDDGGFTLLEVMAVTLILAILVGIAIGSYTLTADRSRRISCAAQRRILAGSVSAYQGAHSGLFPADLNELRPYVARDGYDRCPDGNAFYTYDPTSGRIACPIHPEP